MKVTTEKLPKSKVKLVVELEPKEVQPYLEAASKEVSKKHQIKGFRPGAVPFDVLRGAIGDAEIIEEALQKLVPKTYVDALLEREEVEAIGKPEVTVQKVGIDETWIYDAVVAVLPEVKLGDYKAIREEKKQVKVEDAEIEKELETLRKMRASFIAVPRAAQKGDRIEIDIDAKADKVPVENGSQKKQEVFLGENQLIPEFESNVIGMKEGETKSFQVTFPEKYHQQDLKGRTIDFTVTVRTVQQRILPELTDEFVKGLGKFEGVNDLKSKLIENFKTEKEEKESQRVQQSLLDQVVQKTTFAEFPEVLMESEIHKMFHELEDGVSSMGLSMDQYLQQIKKTREELEKSFEPQAEQRVKAGLALREVAKVEKVEVTSQEIEEKMNQILERIPNIEEAKKRINLDELAEVTAGTIRNSKVFELLEKFAGVA